jgi:hypothetical protein
MLKYAPQSGGEITLRLERTIRLARRVLRETGSRFIVPHDD